MNKSQKGFTLIELLVVIAIIGILAALVLVALGNARDKANDARIKSNVGQLRTLAEVFYDGNNATYVGAKSFVTCFTTPNATNCAGGVESSVPQLKTDNDNASNVTNSMAVTAAANAFCIDSPLKSSTTSYVCVDATGAFQTKTARTCTGAATAC